MREAIADGRSLYAVDAALIDRLAPEVIVTQDLCAVCAVSSGELASACPVGAIVILGRTPFELIAERLGAPERGRELADEVRATLACPRGHALRIAA